MCSRGSTPVVSNSPSFSTKPIIRCRSFRISSFSVALNSSRARLDRLSINSSVTSMQVLWDKNSYLRASYGKKGRNRYERHPAHRVSAPGELFRGSEELCQDAGELRVLLYGGGLACVNDLNGNQRAKGACKAGDGGEYRLRA